ncbi:MAG: tyrosine--tRNA ligase, partial [Tepidisphaeraceae bacterium]
PRNAKAALARTIITWLHDPAAAAAAEAQFIKTTHGGVPDEMPEFSVEPGPLKLPPLLVQAGLASSNSEAIRKMKEGAVKIDGEKVADSAREYSFPKPAVLQLGNRKFVKIVPSSPQNSLPK